MQAIETRKYLGWCPQARTLPVRQVPLSDDEAVDGAPAQGAGLPASNGWTKRYRNQMFFWAVSYTLAFSLLVPLFLTADLTRLMLSLGTVGGLVFSALFGRWLWNRFGKLANGETVKPGPEFIGTILLSVVFLPIGVFLTIPLRAMMVFPAFAMGFGLFIPWYVLMLILLWEQKTGYILMFDKKTFSVTTTRCSGNAHH